MAKPSRRKSSGGSYPLPSSLAAASAQFPARLREDLLKRNLPDLREVKHRRHGVAMTPRRVPKSLPGKRIDWSLIADLLFRAMLLEQRPLAHDSSRKKTQLRARRRAAITLINDPDIAPPLRTPLQAVKRDAEINLAMLAWRQKHTSHPKGGRPGRPALNALLAQIIDEFKRSTGNPRWNLTLTLVKIFLPGTFSADATIHHLRMRVRQAELRQARQLARSPLP